MAETRSDADRELVEVRRRIEKLLEIRELYGSFDPPLAVEYAELCATETRLLGKVPSP